MHHNDNIIHQDKRHNTMKTDLLTIIIDMDRPNKDNIKDQQLHSQVEIMEINTTITATKTTTKHSSLNLGLEITQIKYQYAKHQE